MIYWYENSHQRYSDMPYNKQSPLRGITNTISLPQYSPHHFQLLTSITLSTALPSPRPTNMRFIGQSTSLEFTGIRLPEGQHYPVFITTILQTVSAFL